jgi:hypothetical protein
MSALEQELFDKIRKLDEAHQKQLLHIVDNMQPKPFDFDEWMANVETLHEQLKADGQLVRVQDLLDELRKEASWPRW